MGFPKHRAEVFPLLPAILTSDCKVQKFSRNLWKWHGLKKHSPGIENFQQFEE